MSNYAPFLHSGNIGDVWAAIPAMREYTRQTGKKVTLYLVKDQPAEYYEGAVHPTKSDSGDYVCLNQKMIDMMTPLLYAQSFIEAVKIYDDEPILCDLNDVRIKFVGMPALSINRWYFYCFPQLVCDLSRIWLEVPKAEKDFATGKILVNRTERYLNDKINYKFLKPYQEEVVFIGTMREYHNFCMQFDLQIRKINVSNFLEYAQAVKQSKFYLSNQSQGFQLAEGLKHPRILETCAYAPNVIPIGEDALDFLNQVGVEWCFHKLNGTLGSWEREMVEQAATAGVEKYNWEGVWKKEQENKAEWRKEKEPSEESSSDIGIE